MTKKPVYVKCPRCELNYILKKDKYCEVCKKEMRAGALEDDDLELDDLDLELCPICKINYVMEGETTCEACAEEIPLIEEDDEEGIAWSKYGKITPDDDDEDLDLLPPSDDDDELVSAFVEDLDEEFEDLPEEVEELDTDVDDDFELDLDGLDDLDDFMDEEEEEQDEDDEEDEEDY